MLFVFILIVHMTGTGGAAVTLGPYPTKESCELAGKAARQNTAQNFGRIDTLCIAVPKSA
jgi:hypothetical protein